MNSTLQIEQAARASERYAQRVNREWVQLLDLLQMNFRYERCGVAMIQTHVGAGVARAPQLEFRRPPADRIILI
jgi:hypothetical protein